MARWSGVVGYALEEETSPGIWSEKIIEKKYYGDIIKDNRSLVNNNQINESVKLNNSIRITSSKFMLDNVSKMRYITFMNSKWNISSVDIQYPHITIYMGGVYNGPDE